jgi:hypothetical protein
MFIVMEKLNIAEILKDCPSGIKLYSTIHGEVELVDIYHDLIRCKFTYGITFVSFHSDGRWIEHRGECVLFPSKDQRDWSKFHIPFKDGDILTYMFWNKPTIYIYRENGGYTTSYYAAYSTQNKKFYNIPTGALAGNRDDLRFATKEEKQTLFKVIKENGYKWNPETKTLEKLIEPKFKVGDKVQWCLYAYMPIRTIKSIENDRYKLDDDTYIKFGDEDAYRLIKFDISTFKPFDKVLVRCSTLEKWHISFFEKYNRELTKYPFVCINGNKYSQCVPYKDNEHLLDTADNCDDFYKTW